MDGSEMKNFPLVRATTRGRPYGVRNTHRKSEQIWSCADDGVAVFPLIWYTFLLYTPVKNG